MAWTILFVWADRQAADGNGFWAGRNGLYRQNGGRGTEAVAPIGQDAGVRNMISELHNDVGTFCAFGSGAPTPWGVPCAYSYVNGRSYTRLDTHWKSLGIHETRLANDAANSIAYRHTPAVIGTGWLSHCPVAWRYACHDRIVRHTFLLWSWEETVTDTCFYVNHGWGGSGGEWIDAGTWFAGEIYP